MKVIVDSQNAAGGWRYDPRPTGSADVSVTICQIMALRSARNAEFDVPQQYVSEGLDFVENCYESDPTKHQLGVFGYRAKSEQDAKLTLANTGSGMLSLMLGGRQDHESIRVTIDWYRTRPYPTTNDSSLEPRYYLATYYSSQAMAQAGGDTWNQVYPQIARNLLEVQMETGAWPLGRSAESAFGSTYTTSLAILALTPAYQLLRIYLR